MTMTTDNVHHEAPVLSAEHLAIALHFVAAIEAEPTSDPEPEPYLCPHIGSYERDLLAYAYRDAPSRPFYSHCASAPDDKVPAAPEARTPHEDDHNEFPETVTLSLPNRISYETEGKKRALVHDQKSREERYEVEARLAWITSEFGRSNTAIHSLVLFAKSSTGWNELIAIKLAKLSEGGEEVDTADLVRVGKATFSEWFAEVTGTKNPRLRGVTIQVVYDSKCRAPAVDPESIRAAFGAADAADRNHLIALQGMTQAIFDYERVDADEVIDALAEPIADSGDTIVWLKKGVLLSVAGVDRTLNGSTDANHPELGISPYLVIPHAVLLHNEAVLGRVAAAIAQARDETSDARVARKRRERIRRMLWREVLGNVFHYPTERRLFAHGSASRGLDEKRAELERGLAEVEATHKELSERDQLSGQFLVEGLLGAVALLSAVEPTERVVGPTLTWLLVGLGTLAVIGIMWRRWARLYGPPNVDS